MTNKLKEILPTLPISTGIPEVHQRGIVSSYEQTMTALLRKDTPAFRRARSRGEEKEITPYRKQYENFDRSTVSSWYLKGFSRALLEGSGGHLAEDSSPPAEPHSIDAYNAGLSTAKSLPTQEECLSYLKIAKETGVGIEGMGYIMGVLSLYVRGHEFYEKKSESLIIRELSLEKYNTLVGVTAKKVPEIFLEDYKRGCSDGESKYIGPLVEKKKGHSLKYKDFDISFEYKDFDRSTASSWYSKGFSGALLKINGGPNKASNPPTNPHSIAAYSAGALAAKNLPPKEECLGRLRIAKENGVGMESMGYVLGVLSLHVRDHGFYEKEFESQIKELSLEEYNEVLGLKAEKVPDILIKDYKKGCSDGESEYIVSPVKKQEDEMFFLSDRPYYIDIFSEVKNLNYVPEKMGYGQEKLEEQKKLEKQKKAFDLFSYPGHKKFLELISFAAEENFQLNYHEPISSIVAMRILIADVTGIADPAVAKVLAIKQCAKFLMDFIVAREDSSSFVRCVLRELRSSLLKMTFCDLQVTMGKEGKDVWLPRNHDKRKYFDQEILEDMYLNGFDNILTNLEKKSLLGPDYASANARLDAYLKNHNLESLLAQHTGLDLSELVEYRSPSRTRSAPLPLPVLPSESPPASPLLSEPLPPEPPHLAPSPNREIKRSSEEAAYKKITITPGGRKS